MAVSIFSLIEHNKGESLHFHILSDGISSENLEKLQEMISESGKALTVYPLDALEQKLRDRVYGLDTGRFRPTTLARLLLGSILPETITKCLYIDCDTVVLRPIRSLYRRKLGEQLAALAPEPTIYPEVRKLLELAEDAPYYNAGVLLLNLSLWREQNMEEQCFAYYNLCGGKLPFNDQDILNHVLAGQIRTLPQMYNFFSNYYYFRFGTLLNVAPWYGLSETPESFHVSKHHPAIVHFAGDERPWTGGSLNHYKRAYDLYLNRTAFRGQKKAAGRHLYMAAYHAMNVLTFLMPRTRKLISDKYYERCIRKK